MKKNVFFIFIFVFLLFPFSRAAAQSGILDEKETIFNTSSLPGWVKDVRRWDIVAFGTFPFSMFFTTFIADIFRWGFESGFDFSAAGRRYAPWPFKSAGAVELTSGEFTRNIWIAAGVCAVLAFADLLIVKLKQRDEKLKTERKPSSSGTLNLERKSLTDAQEPDPADNTGITDDIEISNPDV